MIHPVKLCDPCGREFSPPPYLSESQAALTRSCSHACSAARSNGAAAGPGPTKREVGEDGARCVCGDCERIRAQDRTALIQEYAARYGVPVATGPREPLTPSELGKRAARIRQARLVTYEPIYTDTASEDFARASTVVLSKEAKVRRAEIGEVTT